MIKLKPNTTYTHSQADLQFVLELAKVGHVHLLSSQVSLISEKRNSEISFKDWGSVGEKECKGLKIPENWHIEYIGIVDEALHITFGVSKHEIVASVERAFL